MMSYSRGKRIDESFLLSRLYVHIHLRERDSHFVLHELLIDGLSNVRLHNFYGEDFIAEKVNAKI